MASTLCPFVSPRRLTACVLLVSILLAVLLVGGMGGCAILGPSEQESRLEEIRERQAEIERKKAEATAERERGQAAAQTIVDGLPAIDAIGSVLGPMVAQELRTEALTRAEAIRAGIKEIDVFIQSQNDTIADLKTEERETVEAIAEQKARVDAGLNIADVAIGIGATFIPGLGALKIGTTLARRRGKQEGAEAVAISIDTIRGMIPQIDEGFEKLSTKQKAAVHELLKTIPEWEKVLGLSKGK
jgi:hypothetical protein